MHRRYRAGSRNSRSRGGIGVRPYVEHSARTTSRSARSGLASQWVAIGGGVRASAAWGRGRLSRALGAQTSAYQSGLRRASQGTLVGDRHCPPCGRADRTNPQHATPFLLESVTFNSKRRRAHAHPKGTPSVSRDEQTSSKLTTKQVKQVKQVKQAKTIVLDA